MAINIEEKMLKEIVTYIQEELKIAEKENEGMLKKCELWRRHAEARPDESRDLPWAKASNVAVPLTQTNHAGIYATMKAKYGNTKPLATVSTDDEKLKIHAACVSEWLNFLIESKFHLNLREVNNTLFYDLSLLGTQFVRIPWVKEMYSFKKQTESGALEQININRHNGPSVIPIRIEDFFTRNYNYDVQRAAWIATRSYLMWHELKQREAQGIYENIDKIENNFARLDDNKEQSLRRQKIETDKEMKDVYEIFQVNLFWDIDGDGIPEDIVVFLEKQSGTVLRVELNELGFRDVVRIPYIPRPNKLYGMGVGWLCEYPQQEVDMLHNVRNDGIQLSCFQMFMSRNGCGISDNEEFFPLKNIVVDDPTSDVVQFKFPDIGPTSIQAEMIARQYADQATGATNALMGQPDEYAKSRATASGTMFLAQQSSRLFNAISENLEAGIGEICLFVILQAIAHRDQVDLDMLSEEKKKYVREVLDMKLEDIHLKFNFNVSATDIDQTDEAKKQKLLTLVQMYNMYGQQMLGLSGNSIQLLMGINPEAAMPAIQQFQAFTNQFIIGATKLMSKILDSFDTEHDGYLPYVKDIQMMVEIMNSMKDQQIQQTLGGMNGLQQGGGRQQAQGVPNQSTGGSGRTPTEGSEGPRE